MISRLIKLTMAVGALLLMAVYFYMNFNKVGFVANGWASIKNGKIASRIELELSGVPVFQHHLKASEILDAAGKRQIHFVHLPSDIYTQTQADIESASLEIDEQTVSLSKVKNKSALLAVTSDKRIYFLEEGELKFMMTVIWNERLRAGSLVQCATPGLCKSLKVSSNDWGPVQGPFLDSEFSLERRNLPKGRWATGPETVLNIQSRKAQKVWMQLHILGVFADQELRLRGSATQVNKFETKSEPVNAGGWTLYPAAYLITLDLKPGDNYLEVSYSKWSEPVSPGAAPLAAYVVAIGLKEAD